MIDAIYNAGLGLFAGATWSGIVWWHRADCRRLTIGVF